MRSTHRLPIRNIPRRLESTVGLTLRGKSRGALATLALALVAFGLTPTVLAKDPKAGMHWVGTWATPPVVQPAVATNPTAAPPIGFNNQTLRLIVHTSIGGREVRVRLSNAFGTQPLAIGAAHIALRAAAATIVPASDRTLTFGGAKSATIWPGALEISDPVELEVPAIGDLAVSIYLPGEVPLTLPITYHSIAKQTNYLSPPGDFTASTEMPVSTTRLSWYFLTGVDVMAPQQTGAVVTLGDSLTDANLSTPDTNSRWPDELARRLNAAHQPTGVLNAGTGGGRILHDVVGESGLHRFDRDVLSQSGVTHVIVLLGINDVRSRNTAEAVTADDMIAGYKQMIVRAHGKGIKIYAATLLPNEHETFVPGAYTPEGEAKRQAVNAWMRSSGAFDAVLDFEKAIRDPNHPTSMLEKYDCGDHLHPNDAGYRLLGDSIDVSLFK